MKKSIGIVLIMALASTAQAGKNRHEEYARVTHVEPIYKEIAYQEPEQYCYDEKVVTRSRGSNTDRIIGGLIGGAIGNELGHNKTNKKVGAVAGALLGASIADDISGRHRSERVHYEQRCDTRYNTRYRTEISGYNVSYRYNGSIYHTRTDYHPGNRIRVSVNVHPTGYDHNHGRPRGHGYGHSNYDRPRGHSRYYR